MVQDVDVGLIGAGRLGQSVGWAFGDVWGRPMPAWSRRFARAETVPGPTVEGARNNRDSGLDVCSLQGVMNREIVLSAIPNSALTDLARVHPDLFRNYSGLVLLTGADKPPVSLAALLPAGALARIVPIILPGCREFVFFAREPDRAANAWTKGLAFLNALGPVVAVQDDRAYEELMILTSPFATIVRTALSTAIVEFLEHCGIGPEWQPTAESITALSLAGHDFPIGQIGTGAQDIATPGGVTEGGLSRSRELTKSFLAVMQAMRDRVDQLSGGHRETETDRQP